MKTRRKSVGTGLFVCIVVLACISVICADAAPPIKVGVISEWDWPGGQGVKKGSTMAIRDINAAGGLLGRQVEGVHYDSKGNPDEAKKATERALYNDKVDAVAGFWRSDLAIVCQPLVMEAKKLFLLGAPISPVLTYDRIAKDYGTYKYTFNIIGNTHYQASTFEQVLILARDRLGLDKLAIIGEKAAWYDPMHERLLKKFADNVVYQARFSPDATDFSVEYTQAKAAGAKSVFFVCTGKGGTPSVKQWHDMQLPMFYMGYNVEAQDPSFWEITEGKCDGVQTYKPGGGVGMPITKKSNPWYEEYKKMFGEYPKAYTISVAYDILMAWAEAVKLAGTIESDAVVKAFESNQFHFIGVSGVVDRFDKIHNPVGGGWKEGEAWGLVAFQWRDGKQQLVYPADVKTTEMIIPSRVKKLMGK